MHDPVADAELEAAQAQARAEAARARAIQLRRAAGIADAQDDGGAVPARARRRWLRRPRAKAVTAGVGIVLAAASVAASGYMAWQHRTLVQNRDRAPEFAAAARQAVTTLMSIDADHAREDFQRIIDATTGELKAQVEATSALLAKQAEESKVSSKVTVQAVAVQSQTDDSAVVLVTAKSDVTEADNTNRPALWRLRVNINRDAGKLKMSKVEFVQ
ncbi:hypothetical protein [Mycobacterium shimoidei]|uniref:hypothetical protein n=1 Tax=Mycobacterium shimoidei TaxID=29313 RepID=UPI001E5F54B8|nr:hypothetical protein [Mycobacterium shimoidei]